MKVLQFLYTNLTILYTIQITIMYLETHMKGSRDAGRVQWLSTLFLGQQNNRLPNATIDPNKVYFVRHTQCTHITYLFVPFVVQINRKHHKIFHFVIAIHALVQNVKILTKQAYFRLRSIKRQISGATILRALSGSNKEMVGFFFFMNNEYKKVHI